MKDRTLLGTHGTSASSNSSRRIVGPRRARMVVRERARERERDRDRDRDRGTESLCVCVGVSVCRLSVCPSVCLFVCRPASLSVFGMSVSRHVCIACTCICMQIYTRLKWYEQLLRDHSWYDYTGLMNSHLYMCALNTHTHTHTHKLYIYRDIHTDIHAYISMRITVN